MGNDLTDFEKAYCTSCGVPQDMLQHGKDVTASILRTIQKQLHIGLEPVMAKMRQDEADRCRKMIEELSAQIMLGQGFGRTVPLYRFHVTKTNRSRGREKNHKLGRHAEKQAARWSPRSRRYKKWMRVAAKCGVLVWGSATIPVERPAEIIKLNFDILPSGTVQFEKTIQDTIPCSSPE